ncbi:outer membrane protein assembly factor BamD [Buchnera aphidicola (Muscaphis stroyani)]|uniref:Outer membrane protein assembly factor BamD n=1 Tax=Buchnera aphidicola (Muscaphis stroyani) TaxID=1241869 RepID=A0A4D6Y500_9GAMM|nr:outer membrane protein assembly factor BamD [Buchnera aphidicola]QCI24457.1 outer membrane protein assembly factor BamD [Buchnera aphidicola (Muscaphis stroyani)]
MKKKNIIFIFITLFLISILPSKSLGNSVFLINNISILKNLNKPINKKINYINSDLEEIPKNSINSEKIEMNLIYNFYKNSNFKMAQMKIEKFQRLHPSHPNMDYITYVQILINIEMDKNTTDSNYFFLRFFPIKRYKNDPIYAMNAFFQLKKFINIYPKSFYIKNAKKHLISLKKRLSENDFEILKFYFTNQKYTAVINRGKDILQKYPETLVARKTLIYMQESYSSLKIFNTAEKISKIISSNKIFNFLN